MAWKHIYRCGSRRRLLAFTITPSRSTVEIITMATSFRFDRREVSFCQQGAVYDVLNL